MASSVLLIFTPLDARLPLMHILFLSVFFLSACAPALLALHAMFHSAANHCLENSSKGTTSPGGRSLSNKRAQRDGLEHQQSTS